MQSYSRIMRAPDCFEGVIAVANASRANKIKTDLEPSYPAAIMPRKREAGDDPKLEGIGLGGGVCVPVRRGAACHRE